jgi:hypothetical protein
VSRSSRGDVADPPSGAERRVRPLLLGETVEQVRQASPFGVDDRPDGVLVQRRRKEIGHRDTPLGRASSTMI